MDLSHDLGAPSVGHATPTFKGTRFTKDDLDGFGFGPDGRLWVGGRTNMVYRADAAGALTEVGVADERYSKSLVGHVATGPDGLAWLPLGGRRLARMNVSGQFTLSPLGGPRCSELSETRAIERASDGAMWIADASCHRLLRARRTAGGQWSRSVAPGTSTRRVRSRALRCPGGPTTTTTTSTSPSLRTGRHGSRPVAAR